jgi:hypothetical protein
MIVGHHMVDMDTVIQIVDIDTDIDTEIAIRIIVDTTGHLIFI